MPVSIEHTEFYFDSQAKDAKIRARTWLSNASAPKAVVQLVHGMAEHIDRYDEFSRFLADRGFAVCGHDHLGHGKSVTDDELLGHMPMKHGKDILIEDVHALNNIISKRYAELPYFIFGHSMGSFVTRCYLARYGKGLSGAVICGTGNPPCALSGAGNALCHAIGAFQGANHRSRLVDGLAAGGYNKAIDNPRTSVDWLSHNTDNVDAYLADERCGFMFSVGAYAALTSATKEAASKNCVASYPKDLPLLYVAGEHDPVGECGKGVRAATKLAQDAGVKDIEVKLYPNMRHEILNEDSKAEVMDDIASWMEKRI